jgi:PilZ domain
MLALMAKQGRPHRAARVSVPNQEQAIISAEGTNTVGTLCKLSLTGGSVRVPKLLRRGSLGTMTMETATGRISAAVEFLSAGHNGAARVQAFRFIHMDPSDHRQLQTALQRMLDQGLGDKQNRVFRPLAQLAQRAFGVAKKAMG